jgi:Putative DNA-binding domain
VDKLQLGAEEGLHLEFKSAAALKTPDIIARGVVAFLNEDGGSLWVGVAEDGQGRAQAFEAIPDVDAAKLRLQNLLVDTIEPAPVLDEEVTITVEDQEANAGLLRVKVKKGGGSRGPYALLDRGRRGYFKRTGSRIRSMTREELASGFVGASTKDRSDLARATRLLEDKQGKWIASKAAGLRLLIQPVEDIPIRINSLELHSLLADASKTGNRESGWTFATSSNELHATHPNGWRFGKQSDVQWLTLSGTSGALEFFASRERLSWFGQTNALWPFALLELPVSVTRLARVLYSSHRAPGEPGQLVLGMGVYGIGDCTLRPHSPESIGYQIPRTDLLPLLQLNDRDYFSSTPVVVSWDELSTTPDRCAVQLVSQLYRDFGYEGDKLPREYNSETRQLFFPR